MAYKIITSEMNPDFRYIEKFDDNELSLFIPFDESNADYQQYLVDTDGGLPVPKETK